MSDPALIQNDPWLGPFKAAIERRMQKAADRERALAGDQSLQSFASGHLWFGLHQLGSEWVMREWAPNATEIFLIGDFSDWKPSEEFKFNRLDHGNWEIRFKKGIISEDGHIGEHFDESRFFREPLSRKSAGSMITREFSLRLLRWEKHSAVLDSRKCDDLFVIGMPDCVSMDTVDVNVEYLAAATLKEIKYLMGVSNVYE